MDIKSNKSRNQCSVPDCKEPLGIFTIKRICSICNNAVCRRCFLEDSESSNFIKKIGKCSACFLRIQEKNHYSN